MKRILALLRPLFHFLLRLLPRPCKRLLSALWILRWGAFNPGRYINLIKRSSAFSIAMMNGGIIVPSVHESKPEESVDIYTVVQFDGDIVTRVSDKLVKLSPEQQTRALYKHFRELDKALSPIRDIKALISASSAAFVLAGMLWLGGSGVVRYYQYEQNLDSLFTHLLQRENLKLVFVTIVLWTIALRAPWILRRLILWRFWRRYKKTWGKNWRYDKERIDKTMKDKKHPPEQIDMILVTE